MAAAKIVDRFTVTSVKVTAVWLSNLLLPLIDTGDLPQDLHLESMQFTDQWMPESAPFLQNLINPIN